MSQFRDEEENPNRFSDLPQEVTCEILGYLDIQDIARASTLSKEFNKLCTLLPRLCIDSEQIGDDPNKREDFFEFLNCHTEKVLEEKSLRCVNLRWKLSATRENYVFGRFIRKAAASDNVKEMDVDIISNIIFICRCINIRIYIPHCCPSLEKLKLKGDIEFNPISTNSILNLQELVLNGVGVVSDLFVKWLPESCKNLKLLSVRDIVGVKNLTVACPISLRFLAILGAYDSVNVEAESLSGLIIYLPVGTKTMRIFAPNLNILELEGCIAENYYLGNFKFLEIARLYYQWHLNTEEELIRFRPKIDELIQSVSQTKTLYVGENILQVVKDYWNLKLNAVQYLYVHTNRAAQPKKALYLRRFPSLEYLSIRSYFDDDAARTGVKLRSQVKLGSRLRERSSQCYWESANSEHLEFADQIKILDIDIDKEDLIKPIFIRYLLSNAPALEEIIIHYSTQEFPQTSDLETFLRKFLIVFNLRIKFSLLP